MPGPTSAFLHLQLLGKFSMQREGDEKPWPARSYASIYAFLALAESDWVKRGDVVRAIWPDLEVAVAANRLRVALADFRRNLAPAFEEDGPRFRFNPDLISIDLEAFRDATRLAGDAIDAEVEFQTLFALLPTLRKGFLSDIIGEWIEPHRLRWTKEVLSTLRRLADLATSRLDWPSLMLIADAGLVHEPFDNGFWRFKLRAGAGTGDLNEVARAFQVARRSRREQLGDDFEDETIDQLRDLRKSLTDSDGPSRREAEFYRSMVTLLVESEPEYASELLFRRSISFSLNVWTDVSIPLLEDLTKRCPHGSQGWIFAKVRLVQILASLNHTQPVLDLMVELKQHELTPYQEATMNVYGSFIYFVVRRWDEALASIERGLELLSQLGEHTLAGRCRTNRGSFLLHQARFDEALQDYARALQADEGNDELNSVIAIAIVQSNTGLLHIFREEEELAEPLYESALAVMAPLRYEHTLPMLLPAYGYVIYVRHKSQKGVEAMIEGLRAAYRKDHERAQQIALDFAAAMFISSNRFDTGRRLFEYAGKWRERTLHTRSIAEERFHQRFLKMCPAGATQSSVNDLPPAEFLSEVIRLLRKLPVDPIS